MLANSWPLWMVLFALYFPLPFDFIRRHSWLNWVIALPAILFGALDLYGYSKEGMHLRELRSLADFLKHAYRPISLVFTCYVFAFFFLLGAKSCKVKAADARRRLNIMSAGCSVALLPLLLVVLSQLGFVPQLPIWLTTVCLLLLISFPITMAYVIVVQRAMDVRMVIRTGIRYALASTGVKILRVVLIAAVAALTLHFALESGHHTQAFFIAAIGGALIFWLGRAATRVTRWMDRRFFRETYNTEVILTELSNSVAGIRDVRVLLDTVTRRIADSLHVPRIAVLLERGDRYEPAYALGYGATTPPVELKRDTATIRLLKQVHSPSKIYFDDPQSWVHGTSDKEQAALQALGAQVLLPLNLNNRMLGVISLGPKRSEAPYSRVDLQLLGAVASQTGLALENARLMENIRQEVAQRERLNRELEIARDVQQRLFPQTLPNVEGLDFAGYCRPAFGVGGDYYDFIKLSDGCMGIAIGDVSGKGIAAALMMASLQASLRGQTIRPCDTLSEMIEHINQLVYDASADNRYATFFYAQYNPESHTLRYVNAGHNPPILCRKGINGAKVVRLAEGGTVVGLFPAAPYQEAQLTLRSGDVMVAFTDGISEAMNDAEEEWDEERLIDLIRSSNSRSAADMITCILERVDAFTAGARQHDDMTLVVMRVQ
jgi:sigma-B regulation protein RsbU (phosphoserine phosphatase)